MKNEKHSSPVYNRFLILTQRKYLVTSIIIIIIILCVHTGCLGDAIIIIIIINCNQLSNI